MDGEPTPMDEMENKPDDPSEPQEPRPLDYASGSYGQGPKGCRNAVLYMFGLVFGLLLIGAVGIGAALRRNSGREPVLNGLLIVIFIGVFIGGVGGLVEVVRAFILGRQNWFLAGFLTGLCLGAILYGICFGVFL